MYCWVSERQIPLWGLVYTKTRLIHNGPLTARFHVNKRSLKPNINLYYNSQIRSRYSSGGMQVLALPRKPPIHVCDHRLPQWRFLSPHEDSPLSYRPITAEYSAWSCSGKSTCTYLFILSYTQKCRNMSQVKGVKFSGFIGF